MNGMDGLSSLEIAYAKVRDILGAERTECFESAVEVERLRSMWRPAQPRIILLAESHVWTSAEETRSRVQQPDGAETGFVRFIYCLGGGEPQLVEPNVTPNVGASQYWRLFHDTVFGPQSSHHGLLKSGEADERRRVLNKLELLKTMRGCGVWLVDASISALYRAGERLAKGRTYDAVLRASWESHVGPVVRECAPQAVIIIGKQVYSSVGEALRSDLDLARVEVIKQPNAHMSAPELAAYRRQIFNLCRGWNEEPNAPCATTRAPE